MQTRGQSRGPPIRVFGGHPSPKNQPAEGLEPSTDPLRRGRSSIELDRQMAVRSPPRRPLANYMRWLTEVLGQVTMARTDTTESCGSRNRTDLVRLMRPLSSHWTIPPKIWDEGIEPPSPGPKPGVLPLHQSQPICSPWSRTRNLGLNRASRYQLRQGAKILTWPGLIPARPLTVGRRHLWPRTATDAVRPTRERVLPRRTPIWWSPRESNPHLPGAGRPCSRFHQDPEKRRP